VGTYAWISTRGTWHWVLLALKLDVNKKTKKSIKPIKIFKKLFGSVRFHKPEIIKPQPKPIQLKINHKRLNRTKTKPIRK
jgi:hypothetical protein